MVRFWFGSWCRDAACHPLPWCGCYVEAEVGSLRYGVRPQAQRPVAGAGDGFDVAVQGVLAGDEAAFRQVFRVIQPGLLRYLGVLVGTTDAEDVASETWAQVVRDLGRFSGDGDGFRGWVSSIGRHRALDHLRARGRRPVVDTSNEQLPERGFVEDAEHAAMESMSTQAALALVGSLPPDQAEAVLLRSVMGLDARAAGKVLGKRPGAVRTAAYRGLRALADRVERNTDDRTV